MEREHIPIASPSTVRGVSASRQARRWGAAVAITAWLWVMHAAAQDEERHAVLRVGESSQIPSAGIVSFSSSGPEGVRVTFPEGGGSFVIEGLVPGVWTLRFARADGTSLRYWVHVLAPGEHG